MVEHNRKWTTRNILILVLSGCLLLMTSIFLLGAGALTGLYFYSRGEEQLQNTPIVESQPVAPSQQPTVLPVPDAALATLPPVPDILPTLLPTPTLIPAATPFVENTSPPSSKLALDLPAALDQQVLPERAEADLELLYQVQYPEYDYFETAVILAGFEVGDRSFQRPAFEIGDRQLFRTDEGNVEGTLVVISDHAYFWVDDALYLEEGTLAAAAQRLEDEFLPRTNHLFAQPWTPGIDGDERFSILHLAGNGNEYELGYFSDQDEYPRTLFRDSNEQEIVYLNMGQLELGSDLYFGTLLHELQHLFQWNLDKNEATWLNEGLSQLAEKYGGLDTANPEAYLARPDTRLDRWEYNEEIIDAHYANSYLFAIYIWEQLGEMGIYELVRQPSNGLAAVKNVLEGFQPERSLEQFISDWTVANFLDDSSLGEAYGYSTLDLSQPTYQDRAREESYSDFLELEQLAVHYFDLDHSGPVTVSFAGDSTARLIDAPPVSGEQMWYAPPANDTHAQLTAPFDLRELDRATLDFDAWYDLENGFDFAYVSVSDDQGSSWTILAPHNWTSGDYGPGFSGSSSAAIGQNNGWVHESLALDSFAGREILLRFHVIADFESVGRGFALDNISIPELGYLHDAETVDGRWLAQGFLQTGWLLPQRWSVQVIKHGTAPELLPLPLDAFNRTQETITLGEEGGTLVVVPLTPFVDETASYWLEVKK